MKKLFLLLICFISCNLYAQVCTTTVENGVTKKFASIQTGDKDTVIIGQPFRPVDKPGIMVNIYKEKDENTFVLSYFLKNSAFNTDSIYDNAVSLVFTLSNHQIVKVSSVPNASESRKGKEGVYLSTSTLVSNDVLNALKNKTISTINFCVNNKPCVDIPITNKERSRFKKAMTFLMQ